MQQHDTEWELLLASYVDGTLPAGQRHRMEAHLATCTDCREAVANARTGMEAISHLPLESDDAATFLAAVEWRAERAGGSSHSRVTYRSVADQLRPVTWFLAAAPAFVAFETTRPIGVVVGAVALALAALVDYALTREESTHD